MANSELYCNFKKCHKVLTATIWVTKCSHVFCEEHGSTGADRERKCPACNLDLSKDFDIVRSNMNPTEEFKAMLLIGLRPDIVLDMAGRAFHFWNYQMSQEKNYVDLMMKHWKDRCVEFESAYQTLMVKVKNEREVGSKKLEKFTDVQTDLEAANRKIKELEEKLCEKNRPLQNTQSKYVALRCSGSRSVDCDDLNFSGMPPQQASRVPHTDSFLYRPRSSNKRPSPVEPTKKATYYSKTKHSFCYTRTYGCRRPLSVNFKYTVELSKIHEVHFVGVIKKPRFVFHPLNTMPDY